MNCPRCADRPVCATVVSSSAAHLSCGHTVAPVTIDMQQDTPDEPATGATLQRLEGGHQWHCVDVVCSWVESADHDLTGERRDVQWDGERAVLQLVGSDETMGLSNVCNRCRAAKSWRPFWIDQ